MASRAPVILLGFDACDVRIVRDMAAVGKLPTFRRLLDRWASGRIRNPYGLFVGTLWTSFFTGRSAARTGFHCWETISPVTYERRLMTPREIVGRPFWRALSDTGCRVAVVDVPHTLAATCLNGCEVVEYGCHDRHFGFHTAPPELAGEILTRIGPHPVFTVEPDVEREFSPDDYVHRALSLRSPEEERMLLRDMEEGLARKRALSTWLLSKGGWDLFISVFGEGHAVGHQCWHVHDPTHPRHDGVLARDLGDPLERIYMGLDRALADHLALVDGHTTVLILLSHGMGPHYDGTHLLEEILARLDAGDWPRWQPCSQFAQAVWRHLRRRTRAMLTPTVEAARRRVERALPQACRGGDVGSAYRARQRFFRSPNNSVYGGVRINLVGREPGGLVRPGVELDATCETLRSDLLALVNVESGAPVVRSVERTDAHHQRAKLDLLPDLLIEWNHEAPIETVWSPKVGIVHGPYEHWRSGDHRPDGFLFATGPLIPPQADLGEIPIADLGPTICARLGVQLEDVDGRPAPALIGSPGAKDNLEESR